MALHVVAGAIIEKDGKILLVKEAKKEVEGLWNVPGGKLDVGEGIITAAIREVKEETGIDIKPEGLVGIYTFTRKSNTLTVLKFIFASRPLTDKITVPEGEILEAKWFSIDEVLEMDDSVLREKSVKLCVKDYREGRFASLDAIKNLDNCSVN